MSVAASDPADDARAGPAPEVPDEAVRLALELAFGIALLGARQRPPLPVPSGLRPFLRFQKLPTAALGPLRRAVEADAAFRERVAAVADESVVGRVGELWLRRPPEWESAVADILAGDGEVEDPPLSRRHDVRVERAARVAARAVADAAVTRTALDAALAREVDSARALATLEEGFAAMRRRVDDAERATSVAVERASAVAEQVAALDADRVRLERELAAARASVEAGPPPSPDDGGLARRVAPLVASAAAALTQLADAMARLGAALDGRDAAPPIQRPALVPTVRKAHVPPEAARTRAPAPRRTPLALPSRVAADSMAAAEHLLRQRGTAVLIDGYNVAKTAFPAARALADQRDWLGDVLDELTARLGLDLRVVYDGADVPPVPARRRAVRVLFSPAGVTADDVLVGLVCELPVAQPVVVVTDDLALRERVKLYGANVLGADQLLAVARR